MEHPKLRDSKRLLTHELYPINEIPENIVRAIGKKFIYMLCVGYKDITGDDWGNVFAEDIETGNTCFTWQPHGSQFTIHTRIPQNALKFKIKQPPKLSFEETIRQIGYTDDWVEIL